MTGLRRAFPWFISFSLVVVPASGQKLSRGVVHRPASNAIVSNDASFSIMFPLTPVNTTSIQDCYYNCFYQTSSPPGSCDYSGTIELVQSVNLPFRVTNLRKGVVNGGCGGTPVTLPVTLQAGELLLQDFEFTPTSNGSFTDAEIYNVTPTSSTTSLSSWLLSGSTGATTAIIDSFAATPPTVRAGQPVTLSWVTQGASSVMIESATTAWIPIASTAGASAASTASRTKVSASPA